MNNPMPRFLPMKRFPLPNFRQGTFHEENRAVLPLRFADGLCLSEVQLQTVNSEAKRLYLLRYSAGMYAGPEVPAAGTHEVVRPQGRFARGSVL